MQSVKVLVSALAFAIVPRAEGYQTDFHFGMTYWLGLQVGLSPDESFQLASGDEWADSGMLDARPVVAYSICIKKDPIAFMLMREHHFRAAEENPAPPDRRQVLPNTGFASEKVKELIQRAQPGKTNGLFNFGLALHGFQDTYSHRGESQVPVHCEASLAWTHPKKRNGDTGLWPNYLSTNADLTYRWQADCLKAAADTYGHLRDYVAKAFPGRKRAPVWGQTLESLAKGFCEAETKSAKVDWLTREGVPQAQAVAQSTTLEDGVGSYRRDLILPLQFRTRSIRNVAPVVQVERGATAQLVAA